MKHLSREQNEEIWSHAQNQNEKLKEAIKALRQTRNFSLNSSFFNQTESQMDSNLEKSRYRGKFEMFLTKF